MTAITKTTIGLNLTRDGYSGAQSPVISYIAWGSSTVAPTAADTQLGAETGRKAVTSWTQGATGEILVNAYLAPGDAVGANIQEIGLFASSSASATLNSGVLIAHGLYPHGIKLNTESIQIQFDSVTS